MEKHRVKHNVTRSRKLNYEFVDLSSNKKYFALEGLKSARQNWHSLEALYTESVECRITNNTDVKLLIP